MIEVERRTFVTEDKYKELLDKFKDSIITTKQISYHLDGAKDLRIMFMKDKVRFWLKEGKLHDGSRKEYEVLVDKKYGQTLLELLYSLGFKEKSKWFRVRNELEYKGINLMVDFTKGYGYIVEGEIIVQDNDDTIIATRKIENIFRELDIPISDTEEFNTKYADYTINWPKYTEDINEEEFLD